MPNLIRPTTVCASLPSAGEPDSSRSSLALNQVRSLNLVREFRSGAPLHPNLIRPAVDCVSVASAGEPDSSLPDRRTA
jgi:hypothetical protein